MKVKQVIGVLPFVVVVLSAVLHAQRVDTIRANPDAVQLQKIWEVTGGEFGGGQVGDGIGSVGDINGDGLDDWAVHYGDAGEWHIFYGSRDGLSTTPVAILDSLGAVPSYPIVGDFWGTGHKAVGFPTGHYRTIDGVPYFFYELHIFRTDSNRLDTVPSVILDPDQMTPFTRFGLQSIELKAADLDNDGYDELVVITHGVGRGSGIVGQYPETWIYRGGPEFRVDTPTVILRDTEKNGGNRHVSLTIAHADDDGRLDLIVGSPYSDGTQKQKMYFSNAGSPWNWTQPDRVVQMSNFVPLDCDGDGLLDIAVGNVSLFLSRGRDIHTRPFTSEDIDRRYYAVDAPFVAGKVGYLSDSGRHYEMLDLRSNGVDYFLGGGPNGPDGQYEASMSDNARGILYPMGDVNGDGWDDLIGGTYSINFNAGVAAIFSGGPYIPRDPSLGVRHISSEERGDAMSVWPNPATTEVHIAWRGDLKRMPSRFRVHDMLGRLIAEGEVPSWRGEVRWTCEGQPAGVYTLSILDYQGERIATTQIVKT